MDATLLPTEPRPAAKPQRRTAAKAADRKAVQSAPKVKSTLLLTAEASQRLSVHAALLGEDRSALVDRLIREHLRMFRVQDLRGRGEEPDVIEDRRE